jgi:hypothetical protein
MAHTEETRVHAQLFDTLYMAIDLLPQLEEAGMVDEMPTVTKQIMDILGDNFITEARIKSEYGDQALGGVNRSIPFCGVYFKSVMYFLKDRTEYIHRRDIDALAAIKYAELNDECIESDVALFVSDYALSMPPLLEPV